MEVWDGYSEIRVENKGTPVNIGGEHTTYSEKNYDQNLNDADWFEIWRRVRFQINFFLEKYSKFKGKNIGGEHGWGEN